MFYRKAHHLHDYKIYPFEDPKTSAESGTGLTVDTPRQTPADWPKQEFPHLGGYDPLNPVSPTTLLATKPVESCWTMEIEMVSLSWSDLRL
jgi:hypothetical protein